MASSGMCWLSLANYGSACPLAGFEQSGGNTTQLAQDSEKIGRVEMERKSRLTRNTLWEENAAEFPAKVAFP